MKQRSLLYTFVALMLVLITFVLVLYPSMEPGYEVNRAIMEAINRPGRGDYAAAVEAVRRSGEPADVQALEVGRLVVGAYDHPGAHRPAETMPQGLRLIEQAASSEGDVRGPARQQLRILFERGTGKPPNEIPVSQTVADCWRALENNGPGDPARCVRCGSNFFPAKGNRP